MGLPDQLLNRTADIRRATGVTHSLSREAIISYVPASSDIPCRLRPLSASSTQEREAVLVEATHACYFQFDVDVRPRLHTTDPGRRDHLVIDNDEYEVLYAEDAGGQQHHLKAFVKKIQ